MSRIVPLLCTVLALLSGCQYLYPEPDPERSDPRELQFDGSYYGQNAKEYFQGGHYARAKDQWKKQLVKEPDHWMARLGVASCDYHLGSLNLDLGDVRGGRGWLEGAEVQVRELWDGTLESDTVDAADQPVRQWQAALILAKIHRALADCNHMQALMATQRMGVLTSNDKRREELAKERMRLEVQRDSNYDQALALFAKLSAMGNHAEDAVLNYAELLVRTGDQGTAESEFLEFLRIASMSLERHREARKSLLESQDTRDRKLFTKELWNKKIDSNVKKQVMVLERLGNMHFDGGDSYLQAEKTAPPADRKKAHKLAMEHLAKAHEYLRQAQGLQPQNLGLLLKMAQCEGKMELYESAIQNLNQFINRSAQHGRDPDEVIHHAYRLKGEFERKLASRKKGGD